MTAETNSLYI